MDRATLESPIVHKNQEDSRGQLIERIASSHSFSTSARLREFLLYVGDCVLRDAPGEATEQQIGIHVFGRIAGYNSSEDSIVRTHARLLRQKLREYFAEEGANEEIILEIPKGHYIPTFRPRSGLPLPAVEQPSQETPSPDVLRRTKSLIPWAAFVGLGLALLVSGIWIWSRTSGNEAAVSRLWKPFFADNSSLVIYSNALFTGDSKHGLRYAEPAGSGIQPTDENLVDTYTGVGETAAVYQLTKLFDNHHAAFSLKRSRLVTWDDAKLQNLIFIGSTAENASLRDVSSTTDFTMTTKDDISQIVNHHPKSGELPVYSEPAQSTTKDFAIIAFLPGVQPGKHMLIFSGMTTIGTQAAVDFACHRNSAEELLRAVTNPKGEVRPFEAVIEATIGGGVPLQTRLVAIHPH